MFSDLSQQTIDLLNKVDITALSKTTLSQATNLNAFDLSGPALQLYPVLTPLRNKLPREVSDRGDLATRWKAVTGVNVTNIDMGVSPGKRSGEIQISEQDFVASYAGIGLESSIDWEAIWAGGKEFDNKATVVQSLLRAVMIGEESLLLNGNASLALGTPAAPVATLGSGGSITAQAGNLVFAVALTARGFANSTIAGGLPGAVTRNNIDGSTTQFGGGSSNVSPASNAITTTSGNQTISATVSAVPGAVAYAWFLGTSAGNAKLAAITNVNAVTLSANATGTQLANSITADNSTNALVFDGFITQAYKPGSGAYTQSLNGSALTGDGANGIVEIDAALQSFWDNKRMSPDEIWVNSQEARNINKKVVSAGGTPLFRFTVPNGPNGDAPAIMGGTSVAKYWNKFTQQFLDIIIHPNLTPGTIFFKTNEIPYPLSGVGAVNSVRCRRDYYQIEWPFVSRQYVYGVYADEVLVCRAPFSLGVISNVGNG
ncbi:MAG TPA: hypothetical protein VFP59_14065 [Candidatus Angelobacter sp.]|nr:hypothetical protein [Candidatus Angelobacter sp.]